jgi:hypothetical protein
LLDKSPQFVSVHVLKMREFTWRALPCATPQRGACRRKAPGDITAEPIDWRSMELRKR